MDERKFFESLAEVVENLRNLTSVADGQLKQSTDLVSVLRGKLNGTLWAGMVQLQGGANNWSYENDFTVDIAAVGFIDSLSAGPFTFATDAMGGATGPGTFQTGDVLSATFPLIGKHLSIVSTSSSSTAPTLFVAVFSETQPLIAQ